MKKILLVFAAVFCSSALFSQDIKDFEHFSRFNGMKIENINVVTSRIKPEIVKEKFLMKEGEIFNYKNFDYARQAVHDMRIFKKVNVDAQINANNNLDININGEDGHYVFPLPIIMGGGGSTTFGLFLMEANLFKQGELGMLGGAVSDDGFLGILGLGLRDNNYSAFFSKQDFDRELYSDGSYKTSGFFNNGSDNDDKILINKYQVKKQNAAFSYGRSVGEKFAFKAGYAFHDVEYKPLTGGLVPDDEGRHNQVFASVSFYNNIKPSRGMAGSFGSVFGLGTSDKEHKIVDLPYVKPGYFLTLEYSNGGSYTGADLDISTLSATAVGSLELKTRHVLYAVARGAQNFEGGFYDSVSSHDLLAGKGKYPTEYYGERGFGGGLYASLILSKNKTAVIVLEPFVETSFLFDKHSRYNQTGVGSSLYVTFWRFQLPLGLNYTYDTDSGTGAVSFMAGAGF